MATVETRARIDKKEEDHIMEKIVLLVLHVKNEADPKRWQSPVINI